MSTATGYGIKPPSAAMLFLEARAPLELVCYYAARPLLDQAPRGDGHAVLIIPGLGASDLSTRPLRAFLRKHDYWAYGWKLGRNIGDPKRLDDLARRLEHIRAERDCTVSLIGWSLGGLFARELAKLAPDSVRQVITLGTPFRGPGGVTNADRLYESLSGRTIEGDTDMRSRLRQPPPVPTTSIYSRYDGIVPPECSIEQSGFQRENIVVNGSHFGLGVNPRVLYAIADRLAQPAGTWRPFYANPLHRLMYR